MLLLDYTREKYGGGGAARKFRNFLAALGLNFLTTLTTLESCYICFKNFDNKHKLMRIETKFVVHFRFEFCNKSSYRIFLYLRNVFNIFHVHIFSSSPSLNTTTKTQCTFFLASYWIALGTHHKEMQKCGPNFKTVLIKLNIYWKSDILWKVFV